MWRAFLSTAEDRLPRPLRGAVCQSTHTSFASPRPFQGRRKTTAAKQLVQTCLVLLGLRPLVKAGLVLPVVMRSFLAHLLVEFQEIQEQSLRAWNSPRPPLSGMLRAPLR